MSDRIHEYLKDNPLQWWALRLYDVKMLKALNNKLLNSGHEGFKKVIIAESEVQLYENQEEIKEVSLAGMVFVQAVWDREFFEIISDYFYDRPYIKSKDIYLPVPVDQEEIDKFLSRIRGSGDILIPPSDASTFSEGDKVLISKGSFKDLQGEVNKIKSGDMAELVVEIFGRSTIITISLDSLKLLEE